MKITLEFDGYEEADRADVALHAIDYVNAIESFTRELHHLRKYGEWDNVEARQALDTVAERWFDAIEDLPQAE